MNYARAPVAVSTTAGAASSRTSTSPRPSRGSGDRMEPDDAGPDAPEHAHDVGGRLGAPPARRSRSTTGPPASPNAEDRYFLADLAFMKPPEQCKMAQRVPHRSPSGSSSSSIAPRPTHRPTGTSSTCASRARSSGTRRWAPDPIRTVRRRPLVHVGASRRVRPDARTRRPPSSRRPATLDAAAHRPQPRGGRGGRARAAKSCWCKARVEASTRTPPRSITTARSCSASTTRAGRRAGPRRVLSGGGAGAGRRPAVRHPVRRGARAARVARRGRHRGEGHGHAAR